MCCGGDVQSINKTVKHQQGNRSTITFRPGLQIDGLISVSLSLIGMLVLVIIAFELIFTVYSLRSSMPYKIHRDYIIID